MFLQPRHQLDQVARAEAAVELPLENIVPAVAAGAGRAGQGEEVGAAGDAPLARLWIVEVFTFS